MKAAIHALVTLSWLATSWTFDYLQGHLTLLGAFAALNVLFLWAMAYRDSRETGKRMEEMEAEIRRLAKLVDTAPEEA